MCQNSKRTANLPAPTALLLKGQECQECYRIYNVGSQLQEGLAGYLQDHRQNTSAKAAPWGWAIMSRGLNKWTHNLNVCQTLLPRKTFSNYYIYPQSTEGTANMDTAGLELLTRLLFADQHLQEQLNTPLTRQPQSNCWIYQTGSGSFSCKLENKVSSSTFPKSSNIPYCNKDMIILLSSCSVYFKHLVQWEPWYRLDLRWNGQVSSTPFPFFLLGNYWYARPVFHKP